MSRTDDVSSTGGYSLLPSPYRFRRQTSHIKLESNKTHVTSLPHTGTKELTPSSLFCRVSSPAHFSVCTDPTNPFGPIQSQTVLVLQQQQQSLHHADMPTDFELATAVEEDGAEGVGA